MFTFLRHYGKNLTCRSMKIPVWTHFYKKSVTELLTPGYRVLDVGSSLRVAGRGDIINPSYGWVKPLLEKVQYEIMDVTDTFHPDIVGDVMAMPMQDGTYDSVFCLAVLEHVPKPWKAVDELFRVLKPGGGALIYVPFLSPYHAMPGYYGDYFHFTDDGLRVLFEGWTDIRIVPVRGPIETLIHLLPGRLGSERMCKIGEWLDTFRKSSGKQTAGHYLMAYRPMELSRN